MEVRQINKLEILMKGQKKAEIRIYGIIGESWASDVTAEGVNWELDQLTDVEEIDVRINSRGGSLIAGCAIYNSLKRHKAKINVFIDGICGSVATVIAMAGDTVVMSKVSMFMIHNPYMVGVEGNAEELREKANLLEQMREVSVEAYMTKVKITREVLLEKMDASTWMLATEALADGFITHIENESNTKMCIENNILMLGEEQLNIDDFIGLKTFLEKENVKNQILNKQKNTKDGENKMNYEEWKKANPNMYQQVIEEGVQLERTRISQLEKIEQQAGSSLACIQEAKFINPVMATDEGLMAKVLQEVKTVAVKKEEKPKATFDELLLKIKDATMANTDATILDGMTKEEIEEKASEDKIDRMLTYTEEV